MHIMSMRAACPRVQFMIFTAAKPNEIFPFMPTEPTISDVHISMPPTSVLTCFVFCLVFQFLSYHPDQELILWAPALTAVWWFEAAKYVPGNITNQSHGLQGYRSINDCLPGSVITLTPVSGGNAQIARFLHLSLSAMSCLICKIKSCAKSCEHLKQYNIMAASDSCQCYQDKQ